MYVPTAVAPRQQHHGANRTRAYFYLFSLRVALATGNRTMPHTSTLIRPLTALPSNSSSPACCCSTLLSHPHPTSPVHRPQHTSTCNSLVPSLQPRAKRRATYRLMQRRRRSGASQGPGKWANAALRVAKRQEPPSEPLPLPDLHQNCRCTCMGRQNHRRSYCLLPVNTTLAQVGTSAPAPAPAAPLPRPPCTPRATAAAATAAVACALTAGCPTGAATTAWAPGAQEKAWASGGGGGGGRGGRGHRTHG